MSVELARQINKTVTVKIKEGHEESFYLLRFPLVEACNTFDLITQAYGAPLVNLAARFFLNADGEKGPAKLNEINELEAAISIYIKNTSQNQTINSFRQILKPEYVKYDNKPVELNSLYQKIGLKGLFKLCLEVIKFNYDDFLASS